MLAQVKNNLAAAQPALAFEVVRSEGAAPTLNWLGPVALTADGLLARGRRRGPEAEALARAVAFLGEVLAAGPLPLRDVWARAQGHGLSRRTLGRAKNELGVCSVWVKVEGHPVSCWALHDQELPATPPEDDETSLEPWLAPLREKYPGLTAFPPPGDRIRFSLVLPALRDKVSANATWARSRCLCHHCPNSSASLRISMQVRGD